MFWFPVIPWGCDYTSERERERERRPYQHVESPRLGSPTLDRTSSFDREDTYRGRDPIN